DASPWTGPRALGSAPRRVQTPGAAAVGSGGEAVSSQWHTTEWVVQAARSIARMAVSGWLIGSTPTRLTIDVTVPSDSASTHAARCSSPRWGRPGSSTHPDAAPLHSGSDGTVSDG